MDSPVSMSIEDMTMVIPGEIGRISIDMNGQPRSLDAHVQDARHTLVRNILRDAYVPIVMSNIWINEDGLGEGCKTCLKFDLVHGDISRACIVTANGPIEAAFDGIRDTLQGRYASLRGVRLTEFTTRVIERMRASDRDGIVHDQIAIISTVEMPTTFRIIVEERSTSILRASLRCILRTFEFITNAEHAVRVTRTALADALGRGRHDLADAYTRELIELSHIVMCDDIRE